MKIYIKASLLIFSSIITAQQNLDTIYANDEKNVALFFPNPIRQGITGTDKFVFTYNREKEQYFALLQAKPGVVSNLLTITSDGQVYSYILKYSKTLPKLNYFIASTESIGHESPIPETPVEKKNDTNPFSFEKKLDYYIKLSDYLLKSRHGFIATKRADGVKLQLRKKVYNASEIYLVIEITNRSGIDFQIDFLNIYKTNGNKKRKASYQRLQQSVLYKHEMPEMVRNGQSHRFVYVLPKFVLGDTEKLEIELTEQKGSRNLILRTRI